MDFLQIALVFLILLLAVFLSILGIQVFFILKDLKKSLDKVDLILGSAQETAQNLEKPVKAVAEVAETGAKVAMALGQKFVAKPPKPQRRFFKKG
jgi:hypothetical protein